MQEPDLDQVMALSEAVHPALPESRDTQAQRLSVFPQGCLVLKAGAEIHGYAFSHPIHHGQPPALDTAPAQIPHDADALYLHDFVVSATVRGQGHAAAGIEAIVCLGNAFAAMVLISVYGTTGFWRKFGFISNAAVPAQQLASYGEDAVYMVRPNYSHSTSARNA